MMRTRQKKGLCAACVSLFSAIWLCCGTALAEEAPSNTVQLDIPAKSCILTDSAGNVLYEDNANQQMPPASITKIMTLLLTFEALDAGTLSEDQMVTCSEYAASMGGTQIWLEPGEEMALSDIIKATAVNSANDCAMVLAETVAGSEEAFVAMMNEKAAALGMTGTHFENPTGLDADGHLSTARDIAIMSAELLKHEGVTEYTTIWMDSLRNGETGLVNTNKLVRYYTGCTGLKTGTTDGAGSCLSATATRDGVSLIAVSMGSETSNDRFASCRTLLDYGFASYENYTPVLDDQTLAPVPALGGQSEQVSISADIPKGILIPKGMADQVKVEVTKESTVTAPVEEGTVLGNAVISLDGKVLAQIPLRAKEQVEKIDFSFALRRLWMLFTISPFAEEEIQKN